MSKVCDALTDQICLSGSLCSFEVRIGDYIENNYPHFPTNTLCVRELAGLDTAITLTCEKPVRGRYVSVQVNDYSCPFRRRHMTLCDVVVY